MTLNAHGFSAFIDISYETKEVTMKCKIQWVNSEGPTPDENEAVMIAHFHKPLMMFPASVYGEEIQESFPICQNHYERVEPRFRLENGGGWTFTPIEK
jgi:hypothetical protein